MVYYKLIRDGKVFAVGSSDNLRKLQIEHGILLRCPEEQAEFFQIDDSLYRDKWMKGEAAALYPHEDVEIRSIGEEEYLVAHEALKKGETLKAKKEAEDLGETVPEQEPAELQNGESTVDLVRDTKLRELSLACGRAITNGFTVKTKDGSQKHYSLTMQDQTNLTSIQVQILSGETEIPYHADGEESVMYTAEEMTEIIHAANTHKTYHLVYHNALKCWVNSLKRATSINAVEYGCEIPKKYRTSLLKKYQENR